MPPVTLRSGWISAVEVLSIRSMPSMVAFKSTLPEVMGPMPTFPLIFVAEALMITFDLARPKTAKLLACPRPKPPLFGHGPCGTVGVGVGVGVFVGVFVGVGVGALQATLAVSLQTEV